MFCGPLVGLPEVVGIQELYVYRKWTVLCEWTVDPLLHCSPVVLFATQLTQLRSCWNSVGRSTQHQQCDPYTCRSCTTQMGYVSDQESTFIPQPSFGWNGLKLQTGSELDQKKLKWDFIAPDIDLYVDAKFFSAHTIVQNAQKWAITVQTVCTRTRKTVILEIWTSQI